MINPIPACKRIAGISGSGGEAIIHCIWFDQGETLFEQMLKNYPEDTKQELPKQLIDDSPQIRLEKTRMTILSNEVPTVEIVVKEPPVKTTEGSQKHLMGSIWAGALSEYSERLLIPERFTYNCEKDEFYCLITS